RGAVGRPAGLEAGDQHVAELDLEVLLLLLTRLAADQGRFLDVLAGGAREHQLRAGLVALHDEVEVLHVHLAGAVAAAAVPGAGLGSAPRPALQVDGALVLAVVRLAVDPRQLQEIVNRRRDPTPSCNPHPYSFGRPIGAPMPRRASPVLPL